MKKTLLRQVGAILGITLCLTTAARAWVNQASSSTDMGGITWDYYGHLAWQSWVDFSGDQTFETLDHGSSNCSNSTCGGSNEAWQGCARRSGVTTQTHDVEVKLRQDDVQRIRDFYEHTHTSSNNNTILQESSPLPYTATYPSNPGSEWKFQVYIYWPDGTYRAHVTEVL